MMAEIVEHPTPGQDAHIGTCRDVVGELGNDATNETKPRVAASWAIGGVGGLRPGGEPAAFGLREA